MKNLSTLTLCLLLFCLNGNAQIKGKQTTKFTAQIEILLDAFKTKKIDKLTPILLPGYTIKGIPKGLESVALPQIVEQMPEFTRYSIINVKPEKGNQRVNLLFVLKDQKVNVNILFDKQGKIRELNLLEDAEVN